MNLFGVMGISASGLNAEVVIEILVARLARQTRPARSARPRAPARR